MMAHDLERQNPRGDNPYSPYNPYMNQRDEYRKFYSIVLIESVITTIYSS